MKSLVNHLKKNGKCDTLEQVLENNFSGLSLDLVKHELKNKNITPSCKRYSENIKQFVLTLSFYSPKAYLFLRKELHLPHPALLRRWMSSYKCDVGFLMEVIQYLKEKKKFVIKHT